MSRESNGRRDPRSGRDARDDDRRSVARALLESAAARDERDDEPDPEEARRLAALLEEDPELAHELLEEPGLDALLRGEAVPPPTELEWARVDAAIAAAAGGAGARPVARRRPARPLILGWRALVPLAAAVLLGAIVLRETLFEGSAPAAQATIVEVDLPDDRPYVIVTEEGDDGGVMIFIASS